MGGRGDGGWCASLGDVAGDDELDPDRAAILARRRRFIALAISGLATASCKHPSPEPCLSVPVPDGEQPDQPQADPGADSSGPIVEDPGALLETPETDDDGSRNEPGEALEPTPPEVCLKVAAPQPAPSQPASPRPCLEQRRPKP